MEKVLIISIAIIILILLIVAIIINKKKKTPPDYYTFFIIGLIWTIFGIFSQNYPFSIIGLIFLIFGLVNKDKWKQNRKRWSDLDEKERQLSIIMVIILIALFFAGTVLFYLTN